MPVNPGIAQLLTVIAVMDLGLSPCDCRYALPLAELGGDFYDELKSLSSGYASFDYAEGPTRRAELVRPCAQAFAGKLCG